ncbi:MAG: hypothetical protein ACTS73_05175 [Arsenophonus sp. NEOnobi-MAG3]
MDDSYLYLVYCYHIILDSGSIKSLDKANRYGKKTEQVKLSFSLINFYFTAAYQYCSLVI